MEIPTVPLYSSLPPTHNTASYSSRFFSIDIFANILESLCIRFSDEILPPISPVKPLDQYQASHFEITIDSYLKAPAKNYYFPLSSLDTLVEDDALMQGLDGATPCPGPLTSTGGPGLWLLAGLLPPSLIPSPIWRLS
jgi:hypothetical protein